MTPLTSEPDPAVGPDDEPTGAHAAGDVAVDLPDEAAADPGGPGGRARGRAIGDGVRWTAGWGLRLSVILLSAWLLGKALAPLWVAILPVLLGLVLATVLWPPTAWMRRRGLPPALAALLSLVLVLGLVGGTLSAVGSQVAGQAPELADQASAGLARVQDWAQGPPLNLRRQDIDSAVQTASDKIQASGGAIASGVVGGLGSAAHILVTLVLALLLSFFFVKDGPRFLPMLRRAAGAGPGGHLTEVLARMWRTLGGFIRAQAIVSLVDAVLIGVGLLLLGVPLWLPLAVLTFFGGFIPIVGATVAGALAVLVTLVSGSVTKALIALGIVLAVQQIEGHVLQPILQSRSMDLHPALVILSVAIGSELRGVIGAFLAVPTAALLVVLVRYLNEQVGLRSGELDPDELDHVTEEGRRVALEARGRA